MNRTEFMERLERLLWNISDSEREEALQYYNDYFDDAGEENEAKVIEELGSPDQVARKIKAGCSDSASEYSEQGYEDTRFRTAQEVISKEEAERAQANGGSGRADMNHRRSSEANTWKVIAIILLCILASPIIIPIGAAIFAAIAAVVLGIGGVCIGIVVAGFTILIVGIVLIGTGIAEIFVTPAVGLALTGVGCLIFALGILLSLFTIWCCVKILPWLIRGIVGHVLNLAINLLGAYVHTNRLQYVEFFGKFYEGGGRPFNPFNMKTKYVDIKEEN